MRKNWTLPLLPKAVPPFWQKPFTERKKSVVDNTVEGDNVVFDFEAKKGCSLCDRGCCFCYSEEDFLSKTSCTVVLGKTAGNHTRLSSCRKGPLARGGKGRRRRLLTAATAANAAVPAAMLSCCVHSSNPFTGRRPRPFLQQGSFQWLHSVARWFCF